MNPPTTPPENRIAGKKFYIAASYADKDARDNLINNIMRHGGASVGHWLSADYYVAVNYNKPKLLGAEVIDVGTLIFQWIPDAVERGKTKMFILPGEQVRGKFNPHNTDLDKELRTEAEVAELRKQKQATEEEFQLRRFLVSLDNKLDRIIHMLTTYNKL